MNPIENLQGRLHAQARTDFNAWYAKIEGDPQNIRIIDDADLAREFEPGLAAKWTAARHAPTSSYESEQCAAQQAVNIFGLLQKYQPGLSLYYLHTDALPELGIMTRDVNVSRFDLGKMKPLSFSALYERLGIVRQDGPVSPLLRKKLSGPGGGPELM